MTKTSTCITTLFLALWTVTVCGQTAYRQPKLLKLFEGYNDKVYPNSQDDAGLLRYSYSNFYPIGWSEDGKFAYAYEPVLNIESGEEITDIRIADLTTDSIVHHFRRYENLGKTWAANYDTIETILKSYRIVQDTSFTVKTFPVVPEEWNRHQNGWIYLNTIVDTLAEGEKVLTYQLQSFNRGRKTVYRKNTNAIRTEWGWGDTWDYYIQGYFESPFEKRIAIIHTFGEHLTCGGGYHGVQTELIGAHLEDGFEK